MHPKIKELIFKVNVKAIGDRELTDRQILNRQLEFLLDGVTSQWEKVTHEEIITQLRFAEFNERVSQNILQDKLEREFYEQGKQEYFPDTLHFVVNLL